MLRGFQEPANGETFSPTVGGESVRSMLAFAAMMKLPLTEADVAQAFLHADSEGYIILIRPPMSVPTEGMGFWKLVKNVWASQRPAVVV